MSAFTDNQQLISAPCLTGSTEIGDAQPGDSEHERAGSFEVVVSIIGLKHVPTRAPRSCLSMTRRAASWWSDLLTPDGRIEIRVAGQSLPYSVYNKLGHIKPAAVIDNKRLGHALEVVRLAQSKRDDRVVRAPSTAHRADGSIVPRSQVVESGVHLILVQ